MRTILVILINVMAFFSIYGSTIHLLDKNKIDARKVNAIAQDKDGFLWIGTDDGLRRYDGTRFKSYSHSGLDSTSLNDNTILHIVTGDTSTLWIATEEGLHRYDRNSDSFELIDIPEKNIHGYISHAVPDKCGVWFIVGGRGLYHVNDNDSVAEGPYLKDVGRMIIDGEGNLWLSSQQSHNIVRFNTETHSSKIYDGLDGFFLNLAKDSNDTPILITTSDLYKYNSTDDAFHAVDRLRLNKSLSFNEAWCNDPEGYLLVSTSEGIAQMRHEMTLTDFKEIPEYLIKNSRPTALYSDKQSGIWVGTEDGEIIMLTNSEEPFKYISTSTITDTRYNPAISSIAAGDNNDVWIALNDNSILHYDQQGTTVKYSTFSTPSAIFANDKNIYVWENGIGLTSYNIDKLTSQTLYSFTKGRHSNAMTADRSNNLYIAVDGYGLLKYNTKTGAADWYQSDSSKLANNWITSLYLCGDTLWIGHSGGVSWMNTITDEINAVPESSWLRQVKCYAFASTGDNGIWVGTSKGLCKFNPGTNRLFRYIQKDGLSDRMICSVVTDSDDNVWFSTPNGINKLDPSTNRVTNFHGGNGITDNHFKKSLGFTWKDNSILFACQSGITYFNPATIKDAPLNINVVISDLILKDKIVNMSTKSGNKFILNQPIYDAEDIYLSYDDNTFSLLLSMTDFYNGNNCYYEYRIENKDKEWNQLPIGESTLRYHHLPPGDYKLHIRARENNTVSPDKIIEIHVSSPWYSSTMAKVIYCVITLSFILLIYILLQRKQKDRLNEDKLRHFMNLSHDIRSPLTLILSPLETLMKKDKDEKNAPLMRIMHLNTIRIKNLIDQILDIGRLDKGRLKLSFTKTEIIGYTRPLLEMFNYEAKERGIKLSLSSDSSEIYAWIDVNNMDKVLENLISNAFKYTQSGGAIDIHISEGTSKASKKHLSRYVKIEVSDTGTGLKKNELSKVFDLFYQSRNNSALTHNLGSGLGLNISKRLVELHHGKIYALNRTDTTGCVFTIILPQGSEHLSQHEIESGSGVERSLLARSVPPYEPKDKTVKEPNKNQSKILIVDDSEDVLDYLYSQLGTKYVIIKADNGKKALELAVKENPDVIISDIIMPELDGLELLQRLKSNVKTLHIPFIIISTLNTLDNKVKGLKYGADGYINKPFIMSEVFAMVENLISNRRRLKGKYSGAQEQYGKIKEIELHDNETVLMNKIVRIINQNLNNQSFNVDTLCKEIGISRGHLHRRMKQYTGIPASEFIRNIRLKKACDLLKNKDIDISQIAYAIGFNNTGYFATTFKRYYGITPTEYRNNNLQS